MNRPELRHWQALALFGLAALSCGPKHEQSTEAEWSVVHRDLPGALVSVWGTSANDVWTVGADADDGHGPTVLHFDGTGWTRLNTGQSGDLLWVFGFAGGPVFMGGVAGMILRYQDGVFERMQTPSSDAIFGIWGSSVDELWAVGGAIGGARHAFAWRLHDDRWLPAGDFPRDLSDRGALWKVFGRGGGEAWFVGTNGSMLRWDGLALENQRPPVGESLFTVHANSERFVTVGGFGTGVVLENDGSGWNNVSPAGASPLIGVVLTETTGYAVGQFGSVYRRQNQGWVYEDTRQTIEQSLHAVWVDPDEGVWTVGGDLLTEPLVRGVMLHKGKSIPGGIRDN